MNMEKLIVKTSTEREFFRRGKVLAKLADSAKQLPKERILSFEEPSELLALLSARRNSFGRGPSRRLGIAGELL
jgi:hypothetical protein